MLPGSLQSNQVLVNISNDNNRETHTNWVGNGITSEIDR